MNPKLADAIFRVMTSLIFLVAGMGHIVRPENIAPKLEHARFAQWLIAIVPAETLMVWSGPPLVLGGLALAFGFKTRLAAAFLAVQVVGITLIAHVGQVDTVGPMFKNVALLGSLLHFWVNGARWHSWDSRKSSAG